MEEGGAGRVPQGLFNSRHKQCRATPQVASTVLNVLSAIIDLSTENSSSVRLKVREVNNQRKHMFIADVTLINFFERGKWNKMRYIASG